MDHQEHNKQEEAAARSRELIMEGESSSTNIDDDNKRMCKRRCNNNNNNFFKLYLKRIIVLSVIMLLIIDQHQIEAKKYKKEKKVIKSLVKGLIFKNLSTKKNILPMPVPIPVPIEINEPPVYLKGKPKYVTIYKPAPTQAPTPPPPPPPQASAQIYHMPVYSPTYAGYTMDPMSMYGSMMMAGGDPHQHLTAKVNHQAYQQQQQQQHSSSDMNDLYKHFQHNGYNSVANSPSSFTDYDDDFGNYYMRSASKMRKVYSPMPNSGSANSLYQRYPQQRQKQHQHHYPTANSFPFKRNDELSDNNSKKTEDGGKNDDWIMPTQEQEAIDDDGDKEQTVHKRVKRQAQAESRNYQYQSSYSREPPCYGFPLEVNVKSRIKLDRIFPIYGNSQFKKCVKRIKLPRPGPNPDYIHILQKVY